MWAPSRPWSSCSDPAEPSALLFACPVTSKTRFGFLTSVKVLQRLKILKCSDLFLIGSQQRLHPLFQPLVFLVWPNKRDVKLLFSRSHSPRDRWIFWHVMECLATDATAMLIWTNKQSKPTVTAPPRATNLQLARRRGGCRQTQQPLSSAFNLYNPRGGFYKTNQANTQRYEPDIISYPFKSDSEGHAWRPLACVLPGNRETHTDVTSLRLASRPFKIKRGVLSSSLCLLGLFIDRRLVAKRGKRHKSQLLINQEKSARIK